MWLAEVSRAIGIKQAPLTIHEDNQAAIVIVKDHKFSERTKHMSIRHFYVREKIKDGTVEVSYVPTTDQLADLFTKPLTQQPFTRLRDKIGIVPVTVP